MGGCVSTRAYRDQDSRGILVLGLDGAGATTILYQLVLGQRLETIPTLGVNNEIISANGLELECWDIGGLDKMRPLWRQYCREADAVIFVVDASDRERMKEAADELADLYSSTSRKTHIDRDRPLLILANKQDKDGACRKREVAERLRVDNLPVKTFSIFETTVENKESLSAAVTWITDQLKSKPPVVPARN
eukprot:GFKZ01012370.1.p2 GENE.GFKZ01012370.1~~GFKZ01012370.1.p2  ORF type:complete len:192 (+),score=26.14 GFKZ01012370.1:421-996(+)